MSSLLGLPYEVRLLIYRVVFRDMTIFIRPRTNIKSRPCYTVETPNAYNILLTCRQCHSEARPLVCEMADFVYDGHSSADSLSTLCSTSTRRAMRRLYGVSGFEHASFESFHIVETLFPNLEILGVTIDAGDLFAFMPQQYNNLTYDLLVKTMQQTNTRYARLIQSLESATSRVFIQVGVVVFFFGDHSNQIEQIYVVLQLDVRRRKLIRELSNSMYDGSKQPADVYSWTTHPR